MKTTQLFMLLAAICTMLSVGSTYSMRGRPARSNAKKNARTNPRARVNTASRGAQQPTGAARPQRTLREVDGNLDALVAHFTPEEYELNFGTNLREDNRVEDIKNDNNAPRDVVGADQPAGLDAFMADLTPEEYELNYGHKPRAMGRDEVVEPLVPDLYVQLRDRSRASAELYARIKNGNGTIRDLLARGADINTSQVGLTPLLQAIIQGDAALCATLIEQGADVSIPMNGDYFIKVIRDNMWPNPSYWQLTLQNQDLGMGVAPSLSALHLAVHFGGAAVVKVLLDAHVDCNVMTTDGWTPLLLASVLLRKAANRASLVAVMKLLVEAGADVNACALVTKQPLEDNSWVVAEAGSTISGLWLTPLLNAIATLDDEMRDYLLEHGAQVNIHDNMALAEGRRIPLIGEALQYDIPRCQVLLGYGADLRCRNSDGPSIWEIACGSPDTNLCEAFIRDSFFVPSEKDGAEAFGRIKETMLVLQRYGKMTFPQAIRHMILLKPGLKHDFMTVLFDRLQKGKPIPQAFASLILPWLQDYKVLQLQNGIRPVHAELVARAWHTGGDARFIGMLDPDTLVSNFGENMALGVVKRFPPKEAPKPAEDPNPAN